MSLLVNVSKVSNSPKHLRPSRSNTQTFMKGWDVLTFKIVKKETLINKTLGSVQILKEKSQIY